MPAIRHILRVRGIVQGVGFRPTVYRLATEQGLAGLVRNDGEGVWVEVEGPEERVLAFAGLLREAAPPLSRVDGLEVVPAPLRQEAGFRIEDSAREAGGSAAIPPDVAPCEACLQELFEPSNRRFRYPFINCTRCGPRYTLAREVPWDRERTTMHAFVQCAACRQEYEDPLSRRFHAEPNACPACGPRLQLRAPGQPPREGEEALAGTLALLEEGRVVAVKGLGGFLLAVDARNEEAVRTLRMRKRRPDKPLALMARDVEEVERIAELDVASRAALLSPARPIVLLPERPHGGVARAVAPGLSELGVMLPSTPLHHLLLGGPLPLLVMTSGNLAEEPLARENDEALRRLAGLADAFLLHDRDIHARADDSVLRVCAGRPQLVRRARGYVPEALPLGFHAPNVLAVGAQQKATVCLTRGEEAVLSPHIGDVQHEEGHAFFLESIARLKQLLGVEPVALAHDLHPDYPSTRWARSQGLPTLGVQHHHAHVASCLAEHGRTGPVLGVAFDGTGCGPAGELWGGELLLADLTGFRRLAHLWPLPLPGGEAAIREPWRLAAAALLEAGEALDCLTHPSARTLGLVRDMVARPGLCPRASGAGRWFDAVASLLGLRHGVSYEGQAAIELEAVAARCEVEPYPFLLTPASDGPRVVDLRPTVRQLAAEVRAGVDPSLLSARFHETLAHAVLQACLHGREVSHVQTVALSGGCFQNRRLTERTHALLTQAGFEVLLHGRVPPNDGGVALGQAAVAAFRLRSQEGRDVPWHSG